MEITGRVSILLVDDQPENLLAIEAVLECLGQTIVKARSGKEALSHLLKEDFAAILLDVQMPEMDGFETAALIRERDKSRHVPIIFMTAAYKSQEQIFKGYEVGAVDYILKPIIPDILRSKVSVFIELAKKTAMIEHQARQLREAEQMAHEKQIQDAMAFSHAVSHDLRAPLRHIESFSQLLAKAYGERLDEQGRQYLQRLIAASQRMVRLIDAMLKLSEATRVEVQREIVDLSKVAAALEAELRHDEPARQVEISIQQGLTVDGDPHLLRLALQNLLQNAWKYTRNCAHAHIEFGRSERDGLPVYFIRDDGAGFDMSHSDKLFLPFGRLHPRSEFEGTGIGLATVQRIIQRHGGRIWGEGSVEKGATFYFTLPTQGRAR